VAPLIASNLPPREFCQFVTDRTRPVSVPKIFFADLLTAHPGTSRGERLLDSALPYSNIEHMRDCLRLVSESREKTTKTVDRAHTDEFFYRTIKDGFFLGDQSGMKWYPFPTRDELQDKHHAWWRSAAEG
jgi:hypothetical protein